MWMELRADLIFSMPGPVGLLLGRVLDSLANKQLAIGKSPCYSKNFITWKAPQIQIQIKWVQMVRVLKY